MSIDHGKVLALVDRMERHAERLPAEAAKMLRHYIAALRALAQPAEAVAVVEAVDLGSAESVDVIEACTEAAIRESTQPSYSDESPRASWRRVVRAVLDTARNANRTDAAQGAVALIVRDCCELDPADPDLPDTVSVSVADLRRIVERYTHPQAAPAQGVPGKKVVPYGSASGQKDYAYGYEKGYADGWNACREAMLAAAPSPEPRS